MPVYDDIGMRASLAAVFSVLCCPACAPGGLPARQSEAPDSGAKYVEIRGYEGERLGSIADFRENSIRGPQQVDSSEYLLAVDGLVRDTLSWRLDRLLMLPMHQRVTTLHCVEGWGAELPWEGFRISQLLDSAGADPRATTVVFHAVDGYTTSLPLGYVLGKDLYWAIG
jgi:hypothetical protein